MKVKFQVIIYKFFEFDGGFQCEVNPGETAQCNVGPGISVTKEWIFLKNNQNG